MRFLSDPRRVAFMLLFVVLYCFRSHLLVFAGKEQQDFNEQIPVILRELLYRLNDDVPAVLKANHAAFSALTKNVPAEELVKHIEFIRNLLASMVSDARRRKGGVGDGEFLMPGFNMPKGKAEPVRCLHCCRNRVRNVIMFVSRQIIFVGATISLSD